MKINSNLICSIWLQLMVGVKLSEVGFVWNSFNLQFDWFESWKIIWKVWWKSLRNLFDSIADLNFTWICHLSLLFHSCLKLKKAASSVELSPLRTLIIALVIVFKWHCSSTIIQKPIENSLRLVRILPLYIALFYLVLFFLLAHQKLQMINCSFEQFYYIHLRGKLLPSFLSCQISNSWLRFEAKLPFYMLRILRFQF